MTVLSKTIVWVDGAESGSINPADRGLAYGDGLFETMRGENGTVPLLNLHLRRLKVGCNILALNGIDAHLAVAVERIKTEMRDLAEVADYVHVIKLIVTRGIGGKGYSPSPVVTPPTIVLRITALQPDLAKQELGIKLHLCRWRLSLSPLLAGVKHLNRLEHVMAAQEISGEDGMQGLLTDANGRVIESLHHNIFIVKRDELITPRIAMSGVKGVMRALIIERLAPAIGLTVSEQELSIDDVIGAQEVFLCNSVHGIWPVIEFRSSIWRPGAITRRLQESVADVWCGGYAS